VEHLQGLNVTSEHRAAARKDSSGH
jgi:hypothetical protein